MISSGSVAKPSFRPREASCSRNAYRPSVGRYASAAPPSSANRSAVIRASSSVGYRVGDGQPIASERSPSWPPLDMMSASTSSE
jgi:hypothetical protein